MKEEKRRFGFSTRAIHGGRDRLGSDDSTMTPIYQTVGHIYDSVDQATARFSGEEGGHTYPRITSGPNAGEFERVMANLEEAEASLATDSGMSAIRLAVMAIAKGGEIVSSDRLYGGTYTLFSRTLPEYGIQTRFVDDPHNLESWREAIGKNTKCLFVETPSNPKGELFSISALAKIAHEHGIPLVVDSTLATPALMRPLTLGADVVVHSATKYIDGHGSSLGGIVLGSQGQIERIVLEMRSQGGVIAPFNAWLFCRELRTLKLRMDAHCKNAKKIARFLEEHPRVNEVHYPGLKNSPYRSIAKREMGGRGGAVIAFEVAGSVDDCKSFVESLELVLHVTNLGDSKTLITYPAGTTHASVPAEVRESLGITDNLIRLSVGLEDASDIIYDLQQAFDRVFDR